MGGVVKSKHFHLGAMDVGSSDYQILAFVCNYLQLTNKDVLVDVGCGKGRVLAYLANHYRLPRLIGLEINPLVAKRTAERFAAYPQVKIACCDAINHLPIEATTFFLYNPFTEERMRDFEARLRHYKNHGKIRIIYQNAAWIECFSTKHWKMADINCSQFGKPLGWCYLISGNSPNDDENK
jgi:SAM-dependent methyltransferase